jgi:hypothetical protein
MELPYYIYRSRWKTAIFMLGAGCLFILWILGYAGILNIEGMNDIVFILFQLLFCLPVALYFTFLTINNTPLVILYDDRIVFHSHFFPWCQYIIPRSMIISCSTNWEGFNSESMCDLIIRVRPEVLHSFNKNCVLKKKEDCLYFEFSTAQVNAFKGVKLIDKYLGINKLY